MKGAGGPSPGSLKRLPARRRESQPVSRNPMAQKEDLRIAIVGGGISGLSAGHHLTESGLKPVVFERGSFVGGRMSSERVDDFIIDKAAYTFPEFYKNLRGFVHELGMEAFGPNPGNIFHLYGRGRTSPQGRLTC